MCNLIKKHLELLNPKMHISLKIISVFHSDGIIHQKTLNHPSITIHLCTQNELNRCRVGHERLPLFWETKMNLNVNTFILPKDPHHGYLAEASWNVFLVRNDTVLFACLSNSFTECLNNVHNNLPVARPLLGLQALTSLYYPSETSHKYVATHPGSDYPNGKWKRSGDDNNCNNLQEFYEYTSKGSNSKNFSCVSCAQVHWKNKFEHLPARYLI